MTLFPSLPITCEPVHIIEKTCHSKIDYIMIWNNIDRLWLHQLYSFFLSITKSHLAHLVYKLSFFSYEKENNKIEEDLLVVSFHTAIFEMKNTASVHEDTGDPLSGKHIGFFPGVEMSGCWPNNMIYPMYFMIKAVHLPDRWPSVGRSLSSWNRFSLTYPYKHSIGDLTLLPPRSNKWCNFLCHYI